MARGKTLSEPHSFLSSRNPVAAETASYHDMTSVLVRRRHPTLQHKNAESDSQGMPHRVLSGGAPSSVRLSA